MKGLFQCPPYTNDLSIYGLMTHPLFPTKISFLALIIINYL